MGGHTLICISLVVVVWEHFGIFLCIWKFYFPIHRTIQGKKINKFSHIIWLFAKALKMVSVTFFETLCRKFELDVRIKYCISSSSFLESFLSWKNLEFSPQGVSHLLKWKATCLGLCSRCALQSPQNRNMWYWIMLLMTFERMYFSVVPTCLFVNNNCLASLKSWGKCWWHRLDLLPCKSLDMLVGILPKRQLIVLFVPLHSRYLVQVRCIPLHSFYDQNIHFLNLL